jgi:hypothetical protein
MHVQTWKKEQKKNRLDRVVGRETLENKKKAWKD